MNDEVWLKLIPLRSFELVVSTNELTLLLNYRLVVGPLFLVPSPERILFDDTDMNLMGVLILVANSLNRAPQDLPAYRVPSAPFEADARVVFAVVVAAVVRAFELLYVARLSVFALVVVVTRCRKLSSETRSATRVPSFPDSECMRHAKGYMCVFCTSPAIWYVGENSW